MVLRASVNLADAYWVSSGWQNPFFSLHVWTSPLHCSFSGWNKPTFLDFFKNKLHLSISYLGISTTQSPVTAEDQGATLVQTSLDSPLFLAMDSQLLCPWASLSQLTLLFLFFWNFPFITFYNYKSLWKPTEMEGEAHRKIPYGRILQGSELTRSQNHGTQFPTSLPRIFRIHTELLDLLVRSLISW